MKTLGQYLIELLEAYDVEHVFGIPGVHTVELYRGLAASPIRHHTPRHEQGAGFMADGYARLSGKPGVCLVITGPGLTNIATAAAQAYADSIPMLILSGVNALDQLGRGHGNLHELPDQRAFMNQITAFSRTVHSAEALPEAIAQAFAVFQGTRPRPVHIEIPLDLMAAPADHLSPAILSAPSRPVPDRENLQKATDLLARAATPVLLVGGGYRHQEAAALQELAEVLDSPVVMTVNARGLLPADHPLAVPASPSLPAVRKLIGASDVVLALGTELGPTDYDMYRDGGFDIPGKLIRCDIDPTQCSRNWPADIALSGDAAETVKALIAAGPKRERGPTSEGTERAQTARAEALKGLSPAMQQQISFLQCLHDSLPGAIIVGDSTQAVYAGNLYFSPDQSRGWFNSATGFGTLGYALPAAIGAKLAAPQRPVVCLAGDGGLQFTLSELGAAMDAKATIVVLAWDNGGYGEIKAYMEDNAITPEGVDLTTPDFVAIAEAYGLTTQRLGSASELSAALRVAVAQEGPHLIHIGESVIMNGAIA